MPYLGATPDKGNFSDLNGGKLILDADADTHITADTDDQIDIQISGADDFQFTANTFTVLSGSTLAVASGATIANSGTATGFGGSDPSSADGDTLGTASLEWSDLYLADGGVIYFGADQDVTLTHNHNTSLTCNLMVAATTFEPTGDTAAGDNAAIGYTSAEGLILTGQGSTDDITIKNDADTTIVNVATGGTDIEISAGNIFFGTADKGIYLGVTSATSANLLADYEEGTWTPGITWSTGGATSVAYTTQLGLYVKIGKIVHASFHIVTSNNGSGSGSASMTGLPFTVSNTSNAAYGSSLVTNYRAAFSADHYPGGYAIKNETNIQLLNLDPDATGSSGLSESDWTDTSNLYGSITYRSTT